MSEYFLDAKDGKIDTEKYKKYDPFYQSADDPFQIGSAMVFPKAFASMMATSGDFKIIGMRSNEAGLLNVEIIPCSSNGKPLENKKIKVTDPKAALLGKQVNFLLKINKLTQLDSSFEVNDYSCNFES
jgi:hypothetical protein